MVYLGPMVFTSPRQQHADPFTPQCALHREPVYVEAHRRNNAQNTILHNMFRIASLNTASSVRVVEVAEAACRDGVGEHVEEPAGLIPLHDARRREPRQHKPVCVRA